MTAHSPWDSERSEKAFARRMRKIHKHYCAKYPGLMKRLAKLSAPELERLQIALLETLPVTPARAYELRMLRELQAFRAMPPPLPRERSIPQTQQETTPPAKELCAAATVTEAAEKRAKPNDKQPSNVIPLRSYFGPRFFHGGRAEPHWIGGEV